MVSLLYHAEVTSLHCCLFVADPHVSLPLEPARGVGTNQAHTDEYRY